MSAATTTNPASSSSTAATAALAPRRTITTPKPPPATTTATVTTTRPRTLLERQPHLFAYGGAISLVSPAATAYQLCRLYSIRNVTVPTLVKLSMSIWPHQTALKALQMNASTPVREHCNPWAAFAVVGVLQGAVYGQCNLHFARVLNLSNGTATSAAAAAAAAVTAAGGATATAASTTMGNRIRAMAALARGMFRGSAFAGARDMLSQGIPFVLSEPFRVRVLDRLLVVPAAAEEEQSMTTVSAIKHWTSVLSTSVLATYLSQGLHNGQIQMQADPSLGYAAAVQRVTGQHGIAVLYRGAEARVGLLLVVNVLNELLLKPAWAPVPVVEHHHHRV
jgi:hypothetical protein